MNAKELTGEQISALADGECASSHIEMAFAALRQPKGKSDWEIYHQIGDVLRSDDMAVTLSPGFAARMAARLDAEPAIVAPVVTGKAANMSEEAYASAKRSTKRWAVPGMIAAAAAAAAAFVATPQLMVAVKSEPFSSAGATTMFAATTHPLPVKAAGGATDTEQGAVVAASVPEGVVLRDPRIDDYLLAHQRFSPSVYSTAQYARSATFATDSNK